MLGKLTVNRCKTVTYNLYVTVLHRLPRIMIVRIAIIMLHGSGGRGASLRDGIDYIWKH